MGSHKYHSPISGGADVLTGINTALSAIDSAVDNVGVFSVAILGDTGTDGSNPANSSTGYDTRPIGDIEQDADGIVAVSSDQFTPAAGTYWVIVATSANNSSSRLQLYNVTQTSIEFTSFSGSGNDNYSSRLMFVFTANGTDAYEIRDYTTSVAATTFGLDDNTASTTETFLECILIKVG